MNLGETLAALRERIQQRVEGRVPEVPDFRLPSLDTLAEKRQAAQNWASQVGNVNPRPPGLHNKLVQGLKHVVARSLRWFAQPQREFNRAILETVEELRQLLAEQNRNLKVLAQVTAAADRARQQALAQVTAAADRARQQALAQVAAARNDVERLREMAQSELREQGRSLEGRIVANVARLDDTDEHLTERLKDLNDALNTLQQRMWDDFARYREEHLRLHAEGTRWLEEEVRLVRQRLRSLTGVEAGTDAFTGVLGAPAVPAYDYPHFEGRFRGPEQEIRERQKRYVEFFRQRAPILDLACGRGEFLSLLRENGIEGQGVDHDPDMAARGQEQGLQVACGDAFAFLEATPDGSLGGVFSAQFIEHLPLAAYVRLIELAYRKLRPGGVLLLETQNPECLAIFSQSFFLDPTHVRPVPAAQLRFWMEETGFRDLSTHYVSPVAPRLPQLPLLEPAAGNAAAERWNREAQRFNQTYFGYQDYAVVGSKP